MSPYFSSVRTVRPPEAMQRTGARPQGPGHRVDPVDGLLDDVVAREPAVVVPVPHLETPSPSRPARGSAWAPRPLASCTSSRPPRPARASRPGRASSSRGGAGDIASRGPRPARGSSPSPPRSGPGPCGRPARRWPRASRRSCGRPSSRRSPGGWAGSAAGSSAGRYRRCRSRSCRRRSRRTCGRPGSPRDRPRPRTSARRGCPRWHRGRRRPWRRAWWPGRRSGLARRLRCLALRSRPGRRGGCRCRRHGRRRRGPRPSRRPPRPRSASRTSGGWSRRHASRASIGEKERVGPGGKALIVARSPRRGNGPGPFHSPSAFGRKHLGWHGFRLRNPWRPSHRFRRRNPCHPKPFGRIFHRKRNGPGGGSGLG